MEPAWKHLVHAGRGLADNLWDQWAADSRYGDLLTASESEALLGDPRRPYVVLCPPQGNGFLGSWHDIVNAWNVFWALAERLDVVGGAAAVEWAVLRFLLRDRPAARDAPRVIESNYRGWEAQSGSPPAVGTFLERGDRTTESTARLLGCSAGDTSTLLIGRGYKEAEDGTWRRDDEPAAQALSRAAGFIDWALVTERSELEQQFRRIVRGEEPQHG